jgi:hypothetical protein
MKNKVQIAAAAITIIAVLAIGAYGTFTGAQGHISKRQQMIGSWVDYGLQHQAEDIPFTAWVFAKDGCRFDVPEEMIAAAQEFRKYDKYNKYEKQMDKLLDAGPLLGVMGCPTLGITIGSWRDAIKDFYDGKRGLPIIVKKDQQQ